MRQPPRIPIRTCMGCGATAPRRELLRIVRDDAGLRLDAAQGAGGRGGYLHRRAECWAGFAKRRGPLRSLRAAIDRPARTALIAQLQIDAGK